jgi:hypothetical protein
MSSTPEPYGPDTLDTNLVTEARTALDELDAAYHRLAGLPLGTLARAQRQALLDRLETVTRRLGAVERRIHGNLVAEQRFAARRPAS